MLGTALHSEGVDPFETSLSPNRVNCGLVSVPLSNLPSRRQFSAPWLLFFTPLKTTGYQSKPHDGKWTHTPEEEPEGQDRTGLTPYLENWSQLAWHRKMQSKQQSTEKTGVDVWPNVSLTRAELRSKVKGRELLSCCPDLLSNPWSHCYADRPQIRSKNLLCIDIQDTESHGNALWCAIRVVIFSFSWIATTRLHYIARLHSHITYHKSCDVARKPRDAACFFLRPVTLRLLFASGSERSRPL